MQTGTRKSSELSTAFRSERSDRGRGDAAKAEDSFVRINQQAAIITPQELELLKSRKKPNTIAARAVIRRGTGHKYWSSFPEKERGQIEASADELHKLIFEPPLRYPIKSLDLPGGGAVYSSTALRMVYDFITLCVGVPSKEDDDTGQRTIEYLTRCRRVMQLILSNDPSSLGLHPAVYFYSWTGKQQPILFLTIAALVVDFERSKQLVQFTDCREGFESFLIANRSLLNQVIRKFGTKDSGSNHLRRFYGDVIQLLATGTAPKKIVSKLRGMGQTYSYLQPEESPYEGVTPTKFSTQVKSGLTMRELLEKAPRCSICKGVIPAQAISLDHKKPKREGGPHTKENIQMTHPYCNTGYKEHKAAKAKSETSTTAKAK